MGNSDAASVIGRRENEALHMALRRLGTDHMGTLVHREPYGADWLRPAECEACARVVIERMLRA